MSKSTCPVCGHPSVFMGFYNPGVTPGQYVSQPFVRDYDDYTPPPGFQEPEVMRCSAGHFWILDGPARRPLREVFISRSGEELDGGEELGGTIAYEEMESEQDWDDYYDYLGEEEDEQSPIVEQLPSEMRDKPNEMHEIDKANRESVSGWLRATGIPPKIAVLLSIVIVFIFNHLAVEAGAWFGSTFVLLTWALVAIGVLAWTLGKFLKGNAREMISTAAIQLGMLSIAALLLVLTSELNWGVLIDILLVIPGLVWLLWRPGAWPAVLLTIGQIVESLGNILALLDSTSTGLNLIGALGIFSLRIVAVWLMFAGLKRLREDRRTVSTM